MLATYPSSSPVTYYDSYQHYIPSRSSPLSPRSANARTYPPQYVHPSCDENGTMPKIPPSSPSKTRKRSELPFSKRPIKANPMLQRQKAPEAREQRRKMFLQKVSRDRDDQRFSERGEQLLRLDFKSERRRWEDEKARSAPNFFTDALEEEDEGPVLSQTSTTFPRISQVSDMSMGESSVDEQQEAELLRRQEDEEMDELLARMDGEKTQHSSRYGSDDEEYEDIFMGLVGQEQPRIGGRNNVQEEHDFVMVPKGEEMDMSD
ncbi:hypothetical protein NA57DRAFT_74145 [Rhizodiscina lignyota]|uniref:Uncharacterized protein n=1 Tax=Rhizodiscina lignyota TaxID=1504668 RepID=A0A9P4MCD2_9PEZI|nr:hypothetical protein NA57DRAFT_74145 [Rhizodiscina lignyota]